MSDRSFQRLTITLAALLLIGGALGACSTKPAINVGWEYDPAADLSGMRSYAWVPGPQQRTGDPRVDDSWTDRRVRRAIDAQLAAQGFVSAAPEQANFWVGYHVLLLDKMQTSTTRRYYGYNRSWGGDAGLDRGWHLAGAPTTYSNRYDVGTLTVFIELPATQRPIWQGFAQSEIQPSDDMETRDKRLATAAALILEKFPPTGASSPVTTAPPTR